MPRPLPTKSSKREPNTDVISRLSSKRRLATLSDELCNLSTHSVQLPKASWFGSFRRRLLAWFETHQRDLPWRQSRDPYRVWVSEIMLQQTQVNTVRPYFERFVATFPDVAALAGAEEHQVLRLWEGLGYYRRARQLHAAAKQILADHGGNFPHDFEALRKLPGIGRYTAGAIASIAFDQRTPILEANTVRLYSRLLAFAGDPKSTAGQRLLWQFAQAVLPKQGPGNGAINQALMELGSQVCMPRAPNCPACPAAKLCPTNRDSLQTTIPLVRKKSAPQQVREAAVVVRHGERVLLGLRGETARWAGLWDFPRFAIQAEQPDKVQLEIIEQLKQLCGLDVAPRGRFATLRHGVTRFAITLECHEAEMIAELKSSANPLFIEQRWIAPSELADFPLNTTGRKIAKLILQAVEL